MRLRRRRGFGTRAITGFATTALRSRWRWPVLAAAGLVAAGVYTRRSRHNRRKIVHDRVAPERARLESIRDIPMRWEEHGEGVPVVLLHGIPTSPRLWRYVIPGLVDRGVRTLSWELVGFGWSAETGLTRDISIAAQAEYLDMWLEHLNLEKAVFVGHDLGGGVLQRLMALSPERVAGAVLVDAVAYRNWPVLPVRVARRFNRHVARLSPGMLKPLFLSGLFELGHDQHDRRRESARLHWAPYARGIGPEAFAHQVAALNAHDTDEIAGDLTRVHVPARVVWGDADPLGLRSGQRLAEALGAKLVRIPRGRHFTPEDHPQVIVNAVAEVVDEVAETSPPTPDLGSWQSL